MSIKTTTLESFVKVAAPAKKFLMEELTDFEENFFDETPQEEAEVVQEVQEEKKEIREESTVEDTKLFDENSLVIGYQLGFDLGEEKGAVQALEKGKKEGFSAGKEEGYQQGLSEGFHKGYEEGLKEGDELGFSKGKEAGFQEADAAAKESIEQKTQTVIEKLKSQLPLLIDHSLQIKQNIFAESIAVSTVLIKTLIPVLYASGGAVELEKHIESCLSELSKKDEVTIKVHPSVSEALKEKLKPLSKKLGKLNIVSDSKVHVFDCKIEWDEGGVERVLSAIWRKAETIIQEIYKDVKFARPSLPGEREKILNKLEQN